MAMSDKLPPTGDERCGTRAGHSRHYRKGERPCGPCRIAYRQYHRKWSEANRDAENARVRAYHAANRETIAARRRKYRSDNRDAVNARGRKYRSDNREAITASERELYKANREVVRLRKRKWYEAHREEENARSRAYHSANREAIAALGRKWSEANRDEISRRHSAWQSNISQAFASVAVHKYQAWTVEDDAIIRATYDQPSVMAAAQLRRTPGAIRKRRVTLRKLDRNQRKVTS